MRRTAAVAAVLAFAACSSASPPGGGVAGHAGGQSGQGGKAGKGGAGGKAGAGGAAGSGGDAGAGGAVSLAPGACGAGWVTFTFRGTVTDVPLVTPPLAVSVGQPVTGHACFEPAGALRVNEGAGKANYLFSTTVSLQNGLPSPAFALTLSAGDVHLVTDPDRLGSSITLTDNGASDAFILSGAELLVEGSSVRDVARRVDLIGANSVTSLFPEPTLPTTGFDPTAFTTHVIGVQVAAGVAFAANWETLTRGP